MQHFRRFCQRSTGRTVNAGVIHNMLKNGRALTRVTQCMKSENGYQPIDDGEYILLSIQNFYFYILHSRLFPISASLFTRLFHLSALSHDKAYLKILILKPYLAGIVCALKRGQTVCHSRNFSSFKNIQALLATIRSNTLTGPLKILYTESG